MNFLYDFYTLTFLTELLLKVHLNRTLGEEGLEEQRVYTDFTKTFTEGQWLVKGD